MADLQVLCIRKTPRNNPYEGITHLGGSNWNWPIEDVIRSLTTKTHTFYTFVHGKRADIGIVNDPNGVYLRTYADGVWNDNLLALPTCS